MTNFDRTCACFARSLAFGLALAACLVGSLVSAAAAQNAEPRVTARLSTGVAKLGEAIVLQVVAENTDEATLDAAPAVDGLAIGRFGAPSRQSSTTFSGGRVVQYQALSW